MTRQAGELNGLLPEDGPGSEDLRSGPISVYPLLIRLDLDLTNTTLMAEILVYTECPCMSITTVHAHRKALCL